MNVPQNFLDSLAAFLRSRTTPPLAMVGPARPGKTSDLPAITLFLTELDCAATGLGGKPKSLARGVMELRLHLDLANPVLVFAGGEEVRLLRPDRLGLRIPHQPLVSRDGDSPLFLGPQDCEVRLNNAPLAMVQTPPQNGQCQLTTATGLLGFGAPLPVTGSIDVRYRIGQWEVITTRCSGLLQIETVALETETVERLSNEIGEALARPLQVMPGLRRLSPVSWGPIDRSAAALGDAMSRTLQYRFMFEHEEPVIGTGGGPIRVIDVRSALGPEQFSIT